MSSDAAPHPRRTENPFSVLFFIEESSGIHRRMWRNLVALAGPHNQWLPQQVQVTDLWWGSCCYFIIAIPCCLFYFFRFVSVLIYFSVFLNGLSMKVAMCCTIFRAKGCLPWMSLFSSHTCSLWWVPWPWLCFVMPGLLVKSTLLLQNNVLHHIYLYILKFSEWIVSQNMLMKWWKFNMSLTLC